MKTAEYKYQAENLKNCRKNGQTMGESQVKNTAKRQFFIIQEGLKENAIMMAGGLNLDLLTKIYGEKTNEQQSL